MAKRRRPTIDRAVNDALIALYGPDTGPPRPDVPHDKYGLSWPTRNFPPSPMTDDECDACISRYTRDGHHPAVADSFRRLKEIYRGDRRLMLETERRSPAVPHRQTEDD